MNGQRRVYTRQEKWHRRIQAMMAAILLLSSMPLGIFAPTTVVLAQEPVEPVEPVQAVQIENISTVDVTQAVDTTNVAEIETETETPNQLDGGFLLYVDGVEVNGRNFQAEVDGVATDFDEAIAKALADSNGEVATSSDVTLVINNEETATRNVTAQVMADSIELAGLTEQLEANLSLSIWIRIGFVRICITIEKRLFPVIVDGYHIDAGNYEARVDGETFDVRDAFTKISDAGQADEVTLVMPDGDTVVAEDTNAYMRSGVLYFTGLEDLLVARRSIGIWVKWGNIEICVIVFRRAFDFDPIGPVVLPISESGLTFESIEQVGEIDGVQTDMATIIEKLGGETMTAERIVMIANDGTETDLTDVKATVGPNGLEFTNLLPHFRTDIIIRYWVYVGPFRFCGVIRIPLPIPVIDDVIQDVTGFEGQIDNEVVDPRLVLADLGASPGQADRVQLVNEDGSSTDLPNATAIMRNGQLSFTGLEEPLATRVRFGIWVWWNNRRICLVIINRTAIPESPVPPVLVDGMRVDALNFEATLDGESTDLASALAQIGDTAVQADMVELIDDNGETTVADGITANVSARGMMISGMRTILQTRPRIGIWITVGPVRICLIIRQRIPLPPVLVDGVPVDAKRFEAQVDGTEVDLHTALTKINETLGDSATGILPENIMADSVELVNVDGSTTELTNATAALTPNGIEFTGLRDQLSARLGIGVWFEIRGVRICVLIGLRTVDRLPDVVVDGETRDIMPSQFEAEINGEQVGIYEAMGELGANVGTAHEVVLVNADGTTVENSNVIARINNGQLQIEGLGDVAEASFIRWIWIRWGRVWICVPVLSRSHWLSYWTPYWHGPWWWPWGWGRHCHWHWHWTAGGFGYWHYHCHWHWPWWGQWGGHHRHWPWWWLRAPIVVDGYNAQADEIIAEIDGQEIDAQRALAQLGENAGQADLVEMVNDDGSSTALSDVTAVMRNGKLQLTGLEQHAAAGVRIRVWVTWGRIRVCIRITIARTYQTAPVTPLGDATLNINNGTMEVGDSDDDNDSDPFGVGLQIGNSEYGVLTLDQMDPANTPTGASVQVAGYGEVNGRENQAIAGLRVEDMGDHMALSAHFNAIEGDDHDHDATRDAASDAATSDAASVQPAQAAPFAQTVMIYNGDELVLTMENVVDPIVNIFTVEGCTFDPVWPMGPIIWALMDFNSPVELNVALDNGDTVSQNVRGDRVVFAAGDEDVRIGAVTGISAVAQGIPSFTILGLQTEPYNPNGNDDHQDDSPVPPVMVDGTRVDATNFEATVDGESTDLASALALLADGAVKADQVEMVNDDGTSSVIEGATATVGPRGIALQGIRDLVRPRAKLSIWVQIGNVRICVVIRWRTPLPPVTSDGMAVDVSGLQARIDEREVDLNTALTALNELAVDPTTGNAVESIKADEVQLVNVDGTGITLPNATAALTPNGIVLTGLREELAVRARIRIWIRFGRVWICIGIRVRTIDRLPEVVVDNRTLDIAPNGFEAEINGEQVGIHEALGELGPNIGTAHEVVLVQADGTIVENTNVLARLTNGQLQIEGLAETSVASLVRWVWIRWGNIWICVPIFGPGDWLSSWTPFWHGPAYWPWGWGWHCHWHWHWTAGGFGRWHWHCHWHWPWGGILGGGHHRQWPWWWLWSPILVDGNRANAEEITAQVDGVDVAPQRVLAQLGPNAGQADSVELVNADGTSTALSDVTAVMRNGQLHIRGLEQHATVGGGIGVWFNWGNRRICIVIVISRTYQNTPVAPLGDATLSMDDTVLKVDGSDDSERFGVAMQLGESEYGALTLDQMDPANVPTGASVEVAGYGQVNGQDGRPIARLRVEDMGDHMALSAHFDAIEGSDDDHHDDADNDTDNATTDEGGATDGSVPAVPGVPGPTAASNHQEAPLMQTVIIFNGEDEVMRVANVVDPSVIILATEGCTFDPVWPMDGPIWALMDFTNPVPLRVDGPNGAGETVQGDRVVFVAEDENVRVGAVTGMTAVAQGIPGFTVLGLETAPYDPTSHDEPTVVVDGNRAETESFAGATLNDNNVWDDTDLVHVLEELGNSPGTADTVELINDDGSATVLTDVKAEMVNGVIQLSGLEAHTVNRARIGIWLGWGPFRICVVIIIRQAIPDSPIPPVLVDGQVVRADQWEAQIDGEDATLREALVALGDGSVRFDSVEVVDPDGTELLTPNATAMYGPEGLVLTGLQEQLASFRFIGVWIITERVRICVVISRRTLTTLPPVTVDGTPVQVGDLQGETIEGRELTVEEILNAMSDEPVSSTSVEIVEADGSGTPVEGATAVISTRGIVLSGLSAELATRGKFGLWIITPRWRICIVIARTVIRDVPALDPVLMVDGERVNPSEYEAQMDGATADVRDVLAKFDGEEMQVDNVTVVIGEQENSDTDVQAQIRGNVIALTNVEPLLRVNARIGIWISGTTLGIPWRICVVIARSATFSLPDVLVDDTRVEAFDYEGRLDGEPATIREIMGVIAEESANGPVKAETVTLLLDGEEVVDPNVSATIDLEELKITSLSQQLAVRGRLSIWISTSRWTLCITIGKRALSPVNPVVFADGTRVGAREYQAELDGQPIGVRQLLAQLRAESDTGSGSGEIEVTGVTLVDADGNETTDSNVGATVKGNVIELTGIREPLEARGFIGVWVSGRNWRVCVVIVWRRAVDTANADISNETGGVIESEDDTTRIVFPEGAVDNTVQIAYTNLISAHQPLSPTTSIVRNFIVNATDDSGGEVNQFNKAFSFEIAYTDEELANAGISEDELQCYFLDEANGEWVAISTEVDATNNIIICSTDHFTEFAVMGQSNDASLSVPSVDDTTDEPSTPDTLEPTEPEDTGTEPPAQGGTGDIQVYLPIVER